MIKPFNPEIVTVHSPEGKLQYSDAYGLTAAQFSSLLTELAQTQPDAQLTEEDLINYYLLQFPMDVDIVRELVEERSASSAAFRNADFAQGFYDNVEGIVGNRSIPTRMARIAVRNTEMFNSVRFVSNASGLVVLSHDSDEHGMYLLGLRPAKNTELLYSGSSTDYQTHHSITAKRGQTKKQIKVSTTVDEETFKHTVERAWIIE